MGGMGIMRPKACPHEAALQGGKPGFRWAGEGHMYWLQQLVLRTWAEAGGTTRRGSAC